MKSFRLLQGYTNITTFGINTVEIRTERRRLRARWAPEMVQDLAMFGIDAEAEMTAILSQDIARGIDRDIMNTLTFPMVQRVFARTLANDLVAVQPLNGPTGILYYPDLVYDKYQHIKDFKLLK